MASGKSGRAVRVGMGIEAIGQAASAAASPPQAAGGGDVPPILEIRHARKRFKTPHGMEVVALDDVSISVAANEFMTLLVLSGGGKTKIGRASCRERGCQYV